METEIEQLIEDLKKNIEGAWDNLCAFFHHTPEATPDEVINTAENHPDVTNELHERIVEAVENKK